jgi:hypothetical protein
MRIPILAVFLAVSAGCVHAQPQPSEFPHHPGPKGLEAWAVHANYAGEFAEYNQYPAALIIARHGHVVRRIDGSPFLWSWIFLDDGKRIAYQSGPLHFGMACILADIASGKQLATFDCYSTPRDTAPKWVDDLEQHGNSASQ